MNRLAPLSPVPGVPDLRAHLAPDVFAVWHAWEGESGQKQDVPYWATVWPAAVLTAKYLRLHPELVRGKEVLDLGCGGGIAGIAALLAGASKVLANDIDPVALHVAERNGQANGLRLEIACGNMLDSPPPRNVDVILAADMFYDKTMATSMTAWLETARANGTEVYIADASRPFSPRTGVLTLAEETQTTNSDLEGSERRTVRFLAFRT